jgi:hypothetical protein
MLLAWWTLVIALGLVDGALLFRGVRARTALKALERSAAADAAGPVVVGPCDGVDVSGRLVENACGSGAAVVVLAADGFEEQVSVWSALARQDPATTPRVVGICADAACTEAARTAREVPFPVMVGASYLLARAAGVAARQGHFIVVTPEGSVAGPLPLPGTPAEAAALRNVVMEMTSASS